MEASEKRYRYTGKERDEETGFQYHSARYLAPWLGRWTTVDPGRMIDGASLYPYVGCAPIVFHDPTGSQRFKLPSILITGPPTWRVTDKQVEDHKQMAAGAVEAGLAVLHGISRLNSEPGKVVMERVDAAKAAYNGASSPLFGGRAAVNEFNPLYLMANGLAQSTVNCVAAGRQGDARAYGRECLPVIAFLAGAGAAAAEPPLTAPSLAVSPNGGAQLALAAEAATTPSTLLPTVLMNSSGSKPESGETTPPEPGEATEPDRASPQAPVPAKNATTSSKLKQETTSPASAAGRTSSTDHPRCWKGSATAKGSSTDREAGSAARRRHTICAQAHNEHER